MKLNQKYRYSILTLTTIAPMPLKADVVGLKADWPRVPWDKVGLTTNTMAKLATEIAGVAQTAYVIEPFENICNDSVEFGYEIVLESTQAIDPERINRIAAACKMFSESILNNDDWHTPQFHLDPKLNNADLLTIDSARTDYLEKYGNCKIPVPFLCKIDDICITCAG